MLARSTIAVLAAACVLLSGIEASYNIKAITSPGNRLTSPAGAASRVILATTTAATATTPTTPTATTTTPAPAAGTVTDAIRAVTDPNLNITGAAVNITGAAISPNGPATPATPAAPPTSTGVKVQATGSRISSLPSIAGKPFGTSVIQIPADSADTEPALLKADGVTWPSEGTMDDGGVFSGTVVFPSPVAATSVELTGEFEEGDVLTVEVAPPPTANPDADLKPRTTIDHTIPTTSTTASIPIPPTAAGTPPTLVTTVWLSMSSSLKSKVDYITLAGNIPPTALTPPSSFSFDSGSLSQYAVSSVSSKDTKDTSVLGPPDGTLSTSTSVTLTYVQPVTASQLLLTGKLAPSQPITVSVINAAGTATKVFSGLPTIPTGSNVFPIPVPFADTLVKGVSVSGADPQGLGLDAVQVVGLVGADCPQDLCPTSKADKVGNPEDQSGSGSGSGSVARVGKNPGKSGTGSLTLPSYAAGKVFVATMTQAPTPSTGDDDALLAADGVMWPSVDEAGGDEGVDGKVLFPTPVAATSVELTGKFEEGDVLTVEVSAPPNPNPKVPSAAPTTINYKIAAPSRSLSIPIPPPVKSKAVPSVNTVWLLLPSTAKSKVDYITLVGTVPPSILTPPNAYTFSTNTLRQYPLNGSDNNAVGPPDGTLSTSTSVTLTYEQAVSASQLLLTGKLSPSQPITVSVIDAAGTATKVFSGVPAIPAGSNVFPIPLPASDSMVKGVSVSVADPQGVGLDAVQLVGLVGVGCPQDLCPAPTDGVTSAGSGSGSGAGSGSGSDSSSGSKTGRESGPDTAGSGLGPDDDPDSGLVGSESTNTTTAVSTGSSAAGAGGVNATSANSKGVKQRDCGGFRIDCSKGKATGVAVSVVLACLLLSCCCYAIFATLAAKRRKRDLERQWLDEPQFKMVSAV